jgi:thymidylate synthase
VYSNHKEQVELQLSRTPLPYPVLNINRRPASIFDYRYDDFEIQGYEPHGPIKAPVAV